MKNKMVISGMVIVIMLSLVILPVMSNPILKSDSIYRKNIGKVTKGFYFSRVDISGIGEYSNDVPVFIFWNLTEGQISIKALFSNSNNFPSFPYKLFDNYYTADSSNGVLMLFIGTKSNDPFEIHGFSVLSIVEST